jgi:hypothetical protein
MPQIKFTELDFTKIKDNLKIFLKAQDQFKDYDFDGAGVSVLLDILAYNTAYNGFYLNMLASEMFLDSAVQRDSVVSRAKHLGYTPRSVRSTVATVDIEIFPSQGPGNPNPSSVYVDLNQRFYSIVDNQRYTFSPTKSFLIQPNAGKYIAKDINLIEGIRLTHRWTFSASGSVQQRFIIPNANVDTTQLKITVQDSASTPVIKLYNLHEDLNEIGPDDQVYFLQENTNSRYEIVFGDGAIGKALIDGNIVIAEYVVSSGGSALGSKRFLPLTKIGGYDFSVITTTVAASGYVDQESVDSVKKLAPLAYDAQNRAVTRLDYETLIKKDIPSIQYLRVWGGEDQVPPQYGRVFVSLKPFTGLTLSEDQKVSLINTYIRPRNPISIEVVIVEPEFLRLQVNCLIQYRSSNTTLSEADIKNRVQIAIEDFRATELNDFDSDFRYSKFIQAIDAADAAITGNLTTINMKYRIFPPFNVPTKFEIKLNNPVDRGDSANGLSAITSSGFIFKGILTYVGDDGQGSLYLFRIVNDQQVIIQRNVGTVNYVLGDIQLDGFLVQSIPGGKDYVDLTIMPKVQDIESLRNQILLMEDEDILLATKDLSRAV